MLWRFLLKNLFGCLVAIMLGIVGVCYLIYMNAYFYSVRFDFILEPRFKGELLMVEDPKVPLQRGNKLYTLVQRGNLIYVPDGYLLDSPDTGETPMVTTWQQGRVWDTTGKLISEGQNPPPGILTIRGEVSKSGPDAREGEWSRMAKYFIVSDR